MRPPAQARCGTEGGCLTDRGLQRCPARGRVSSHGKSGSLDRVGDRAELGVGARQDRHFAGADQVRVAPQEELRDVAALVGLVVGDEPLDARPIGPVRHERARLIGGGEHVHAGGDDLRCASMVDRQPDHLDAGEAGLDVDEQARVGAVEAVDRLRRVADEEQVVAAGAEQVDERVLERVEVLGLVDEQVAESPAHGGCEARGPGGDRGSCRRARRRSR